MATPARPPRVVAMAHRGAHAVPGPAENTVAAVAAAAALGYRWVETDVRATADGVLVLAHDADLARTTGRALEVAAHTAQQLDDLLGPAAPALLEEVVDAVPSVCLNIDVKAPGAIRPLVALLTRRPELVDRVRVASFSEVRRLAVLAGLAAARVRAPASSASAPLVAACWVVAHAPVPVRGRAAGLAGLARVLRIDALQVPETTGARVLGRVVVVRVVTPALLAVARAAGVGVHVWVVDAPADMHRLLDAGVEGLVTDQAALLALVLTDRGRWPPGAARPGAPRPHPPPGPPGQR